MADPQRLARLARLREVERHRAAERAAASGRTLDRLLVLAERSRDLASSYAVRDDAADGAALAGLFAFRIEINALSDRTAGDATAARFGAEQALLALSLAQRRCDFVSERLHDARLGAEHQREQASPGASARSTLARSLNGKGGNKPRER